MACTISDKTQDLVTALNDKFQYMQNNCACASDVGIPIDTTTLCGDVDKDGTLIAQIHRAAILMETQCGMLHTAPNPGLKGQTCITLDYLDDLLLYITGLECPDTEEPECDPIIVNPGEVDHLTEWFDGEDYFEAGDYVITPQESTLGVNSGTHGFQVPPGGTTYYGIGHQATSQTAATIWTSIVLVYLDGTTEESEYADLQSPLYMPYISDTNRDTAIAAIKNVVKDLTIDRPAKIGIRVKSQSGETQIFYGLSVLWEIRECPNRCLPRQVTSIKDELISAGATLRLSLERDGVTFDIPEDAECEDGHDVYLRPISSCIECTPAVDDFTLDELIGDNTEDTVFEVPGAFYEGDLICLRTRAFVATPHGTRETFNTFCKEIGCFSEPAEVLTSGNLIIGGTYVRYTLSPSGAANFYPKFTFVNAVRWELWVSDSDGILFKTDDNIIADPLDEDTVHIGSSIQANLTSDNIKTWQVRLFDKCQDLLPDPKPYTQASGTVEVRLTGTGGGGTPTTSIECPQSTGFSLEPGKSHKVVLEIDGTGDVAWTASYTSGGSSQIAGVGGNGPVSVFGNTSGGGRFIDNLGTTFTNTALLDGGATVFVTIICSGA